MSDESSDILASSGIHTNDSSRVLNITPSELLYEYPTHSNKTINENIIKLENTLDDKVIFKIMTTAPKKYTIKPSFGIIEPKEQTQVSFCLLGEHHVNFVDKFQILVIILNKNDEDLLTLSKREIWDKVYRKDKVIKHRFISKGVYKESSTKGGSVQTTVPSTPVSTESKANESVTKQLYQTPIKPKKIETRTSEIDLSASLKRAEKNLLNLIFVLSGLFFVLFVLRYFI